jgi:hypothetical protein
MGDMRRSDNSKNHTQIYLRGFALILNFLLSWTILPLALPPWRGYSAYELFEVLLWQAMGAIGWPLSILGGLANSILGGNVPSLGTLLLVLIYPVMLILLVIVLVSRRASSVGLILLHILLTLSFAAVWIQVLNGVKFSMG